MISVNGIGVAFEGNDLFKDISFIIQPKDRIGLVGKNGVGKSTLLKIIAGIQEPTFGNIASSDGETIGYLPQEIAIDSTRTVFDEAMQAFKDVLDLEEEEKQITEALTVRTDYESDDYQNIIDRLNEIHQRLGILGSNKAESQVEKVLKGLGFKEEEFQRPLSTFSGGWQMRVELAKLLILQPTVLLLDEPTNHLDIEAILWLENFFINYPGAIVMISHDRMFLDNITNRTIEIVFGKIYDYKANYSKYMVLREERFEQQMATIRNQQKYIEQQERFIERFRSKASKSKQVQSRIKALEKVDVIEADEMDSSSIRFKFPPAPRSGDVVLKSTGLTKTYGSKMILNNIEFQIDRGDRVAFVGQNGQGKSTLVKLVCENLDYAGNLTVGHNVNIGYYAQIQENTLNPEETVFNTIDNIATDEWRNIARIRALLGAFLFGPNDMEKRVKVLSGGEKSRLAIARLLLNPCNLLILDEPTNHLDIASKEILKDALLKYDGTLIVVSHDRDFLQGLTNKTYEFVNNGIKEHLGEINEFLNHHSIETFREFEKAVPTKKAEKKQEKVAKSPEISNEQRKEQEKQLKQIKNRISKCESDIQELENKIKVIEVEMNHPDFYADTQKSTQVVYEHNELNQKLNKVMSEWEQLLEEVEKFS